MQKSFTDIFLSPEIFLGRGLGPLRFGMYPEETLELLGDPQATDLRHPKKGVGAVMHHYPHLGFNLTFDEEDGHRLTYIDVVGGNFRLLNAFELGMDFKACETKVGELGLGIPTREICSKWDLLCFHGHSLICWFQSGKLLKLSFGHYWGPDGTPLWPEG